MSFSESIGALTASCITLEQGQAFGEQCTLSGRLLSEGIQERRDIEKFIESERLTQERRTSSVCGVDPFLECLVAVHNLPNKH
jgi:hypothetical protein